MSEESDLDILREEIRKVTFEIIYLIGKRLALAKKIGDIKNQRDLPIEDLKAERELKRVSLEKCRDYGVDPRFGVKLLNLLIDESKRTQAETTDMNSS